MGGEALPESKSSFSRPSGEIEPKSFWSNFRRTPLFRDSAHAVRDFVRVIRTLGAATVELDREKRRALFRDAAQKLRLVGGETARELDRLRWAMKVPAAPRLLGERLKGQKVLWVGPCHIEALSVFGAHVACEGEHLLFTSLPHEAAEFSGAGYDAIVVGLNLSQLLTAIPAGGRPYLAHLHPDWTEAMAGECLALCGGLIEKFIRHFIARAEGAPLFVTSILEPSFDYMGLLNKDFGPTHIRTFVRNLNEIILRAVQNETGCYFLDLNEIASSVGTFHLRDDIHLFSARASFVAEGDVEYDIEAGRVVPPVAPNSIYDIHNRWRMTCEVIWDRILDGLKIIRQIETVKLIILDLDDTLWRGVAAEGDHDTYFRTIAWPTGFVEALLYFKRRGGLLAICSKNDEAPTRERFAAIWRDLIRLEDFVSVKINWLPKSENVAQILDETNILPGNVVFVDDNPREVDEVRARFPAVRGLGFQHYDWRRIVLQAPEMQVAAVTGESRERTQLVRARIDREQASEGVDRRTWLKSLDLKQKIVAIRSTRDPGFARAFELINKTNQFNTTGQRWTQAEFEAFFSRGGLCLTSALRDKTVDNGVIGVLLLCGAEILQAVLSCRVFGLGAELAMGAVATELALKSAPTAFATIVNTDKNLASRDYYVKLGYWPRAEAKGIFEVGTAPLKPDWVEVSIDPSVNR
jgi:FkbH-like protein